MIFKHRNHSWAPGASLDLFELGGGGGGGGCKLILPSYQGKIYRVTTTANLYLWDEWGTPSPPPPHTHTPLATPLVVTRVGMVDFTGSGVRIADADCEPMQIVYFFGKKPQ